MPFDPTSKADIKRLKGAIQYSRRKQEPFLDQYTLCVKQFTGRNYGAWKGGKRTPVNMLELMVSVMTRSMAAENPRVFVTTDFPDLESQARIFQAKINRQIEEINLVETLRSAITQALLAPFATIFTGVSNDYQVEIMGYLHDIGDPFSDIIDFYDVILDMHARHWDQLDFVGHRFCVSLDDLQNNPSWDQDVVDQLSSDTRLGSDTEPGKHISEISLGEEGYSEPLREYVELQGVWVPYNNSWIVTAVNGPDEVLNTNLAYDGPETGPYRRLFFQSVPGQLMPLSPATNLYDLGDSINRLYTKLMRQADRQKEYLAYVGQAENEAARHARVPDAGTIKINTPNGVSRMKAGGADPQSIAMAIHLRQLYDRLAGNISVLGGLSNLTGTVGQEELLNSNASRQVKDMETKFLNFTRDVVKDLGWYIWTDPLREDVISERVGKAQFRMEQIWSPETREGDFTQYDLKIEPYSMQAQSPATKLQSLMNIYTGVVLPQMALGMQQGSGIDFNGLMDLISRYGNLPELKQIVKYMDKSPVPPAAGSTVPKFFNPMAREGGGSPTLEDDEQKLLERLLPQGASPGS